VETAGVEPAPPRCKRGALPPELHPRGVVRTGGVEPQQRVAAGLQPAELADARRPRSGAGSAAPSIRTRRLPPSRPSQKRPRGTLELTPQRPEGWPAGLEPAPSGITTPDAAALHHGHHGARTAGFEPATSRSTTERSAAELRPRGSAGGIRTRDLELMRLARTAPPPPRDEQIPSTPPIPASPGRLTKVLWHEPRSKSARLRTERLRRQDSNLRLASNSRASHHLDHAGPKRNAGRCRCGGLRPSQPADDLVQEEPLEVIMAREAGRTSSGDGRGWHRTSDFLFVGEALCLLSYSPERRLRSVRRPRADDRRSGPPSIHVTPGRRRELLSKPLACPSTLDRPRPGL
jgi:hypothetical protein